MKNPQIKINWRVVHLKLGKLYIVTVGAKAYTCRFIKTSRTGYNFLHIDTHECILRQNLYESSKLSFNDKTDTLRFFIQDWYKIIEFDTAAINDN